METSTVEPVLQRTTLKMEVKQILNSIAESRGFTISDVEDVQDSLTGNGYIGIVSKCCIKHSRKEEGKSLNLVIKSAPKNDLLRKQTQVQQLFAREIYMYETVFPEFKKFQQMKNIANPFVNIKCYATSLSDKNEVLVLKDISFEDYKLPDRFNNFDDNHIKLVLETYGKFHALSFALREHIPTCFETLTAPMNCMWKYLFETTKFIATFISFATKVIDVLQPEDEFYIKEYRKFIEKGIEHELMDCFDGDSQYFVITHGDCWANNFMFKYEGMKPTSMYLLDFQASSLTTPVADLSHFLCTCAGKEVFDKIDEYLTIYHNSLSSHLEHLGTDPDKVYPFSIFKEHWKRYSKYGLIISALVVHGTLSTPDEFRGLDRVLEDGEEITQSFDYPIANRKLYEKKMRDLLIHFIDNKFI